MKPVRPVRTGNAARSKTLRSGVGPLAALLLCVLLPGVTGCAANTRPFTSRNPGLSRVATVAVIPFENESQRIDAGSILTDVFVEEIFFASRFRVMEIANVRSVLVQERIRFTKEMDMDFIRKVGARLHVDGVILGSVQEYVEGEHGPDGGIPVVALNARLVETVSGKVLWSCFNRRTGEDYTRILDFGRIRTALKLAHVLTREMLNTMGEHKSEEAAQAARMHATDERT